MGFMGMRGDGDWATDQFPETWREEILHEFPNGDAPITAITSMMASEATDSPIFHWWDKRLQTQSGAVTSVYIDAGLGTEYVYATHQATHGVADAVVYVNAAEAIIQHFREGHLATLRDESRFDVDMTGTVVDVVTNGSSSYVAVKLLEDDDNSETSATWNLATVDRVINSSDANAEGAPMPRAIAYDPTGYYNHTQIIRTPLEMTRTAMKTRLRTGDQVEEAKREALQLHGAMIERGMIWGVRSTGNGPNGKPLRTFDGIQSFIRRNASTAIDLSTTDASINSYKYNTKFSGQSWLDGGEDFFDDCLEYLGTYAPGEMLAFCGGGAITGLNRLAKYTGTIMMDPGPNDAYGMKFKTWVNPHITIHIKKHPLLAQEPSMKNSMILLAPQNIKWMVVDDTDYFPDQTPKGIDGVASEWLAEIGPELHFADQFMMLHDIGVANAV